MGRLLSENLWTEIQAASTKVPKMAAVAYVSSDQIIKFGNGDTLITDASDETIAAGQTRARVLEAAFRLGATLYSLPNLHAKIMVLGDTAVIGSANISSNSANGLAEVGWITDQPAEVQEARTLIERLIARSVPIDQAFITRILNIRVRPRPRGPGQPLPPVRPDNVMLFFKQAKSGDLRKYNRQSADAQTGGGARDLRISPADLYRAPLQQILANPGPQLDVTQGEIYWTSPTGGISHSTVELWSPTRQRPLELRFARWWTVKSWEIPDAVFLAEEAAGRRMFYILEFDASGMAWARVLREADLATEAPAVAQHIRNRIRDTPQRNSAIGLIDLTTGQTLP